MFAYCNNNPVLYHDTDGTIAITTLILVGSIIVGAVAAAYTAYTETKAGCDTAQIINDSLLNGLCAFSIVYSGGMMAYQCYQNFCYLNAMTPVTEVGVAQPETIELYRATSVDEYMQTIDSQSFSANKYGYDSGKFFATSIDDAETWASKLYKAQDYGILQVTFDKEVLTAQGTMFWDRLDSIGPAYFITLEAANHFQICIKG